MLHFWRRTVGLVVLISIIGVVLGIKAVSRGWFSQRQPLVLNGQPALLFFTISRVCDCQMKVIRSAEAQLATWQVAQNEAIPILWVDFSRRPDLDRQYIVARSPALVLLDAQGQVVWKQDVGLSDEAPLDLIQAQNLVNALISDDAK